MITFLVTLLLICVLVYVAHLVIGLLKLPDPIKTIAYIIVGLIVLFWLLNYFGIYSFPLR